MHKASLKQLTALTSCCGRTIASHQSIERSVGLPMWQCVTHDHSFGLCPNICNHADSNLNRVTRCFRARIGLVFRDYMGSLSRHNHEEVLLQQSDGHSCCGDQRSEPCLLVPISCNAMSSTYTHNLRLGSPCIPCADSPAAA